MSFEEDTINSERYGDSNEVNYDLIFKELISKQKVKEAIDKVLKKGFQYSEGYNEQLTKELGGLGE